MRKGKITKAPPKKHTVAERARLKRLKQKTGPSALRRKEARAGLQPKPVQ